MKWVSVLLCSFWWLVHNIKRFVMLYSTSSMIRLYQMLFYCPERPKDASRRPTISDAGEKNNVMSLQERITSSLQDRFEANSAW
jgi:hypothetical protein